MLTHAELVEVGRRWLLRPWRNAGAGHSACCVVLTEIVTGASETPDVIGWSGFSRSVLIECKTSRSDFKADGAKHFRRHPEMGMGVHRFYLAPVGILAEDEIPGGWGFIEADDNHNAHVRRASGVFAVDRGAEVRVLLSLLRRLKVDPGLHVAIRAYQHMIREPKATVTFAFPDEGAARCGGRVTGRGRRPT